MKKTLDSIISVVSYLVGLLLLAAIFVIALQVIWRYVFVNPLSWTEQTCRYMFVYIVTLAIPVAYYKGTMLTFDLILNSLNHTLFTIVQALINVLSLIFFFYYGYITDLFFHKQEGSMQMGPSVFLCRAISIIKKLYQ